MPKRPDGDGSAPRERKDGRWEAKVSLPYGPGGKRRRRSVYGATQAECLAHLNALKRKVAENRLPTEGLTLGVYLKSWLKTKKLEVEPRTAHDYRRDAERYILPHVAKVKLEALNVRQVKLMQAHIKEASGAYTANRARALLSNALSDAVSEGLLPFNPAANVKPVKHARKEVRIWSAPEITAALAEAERSTRLYALFYLALATGMRFGELTGLTWSRVSLYPTDHLGAASDHGHLKIDQAAKIINNRSAFGAPKTKSSRRELGLTKEARAVLEAQRFRTDCEKAVATRYEDLDLVFPSGAGTFLEHSNVDRTLKRVIHTAGVTPITFHGFRHTFASMMIANHIDVVKLARMLGHTSPGFTLRTYAHLFERHQRLPMPSLSSLTGQAGGGQGGGQNERDALPDFEKTRP